MRIRKEEWAFTAIAKHYYQVLVDSGLDPDLAVEVVEQLLPEEECYERPT